MNIEDLFNILLQDSPSIILKKKEELLFFLIPELFLSKNFSHNNVWHQYDVLEHIYHVVDNVPNNLILRLSALFHDIGKPYVYTEDENGIGHFYGHWDVSKNIFINFANKYQLDNDMKNTISNLIYYHDVNIKKMNDKRLDELLYALNDDEISMLFELKRADLLSQNEKFHYLLNDYNEQKNRVLTKYREKIEKQNI